MRRVYKVLAASLFMLPVLGRYLTLMKDFLALV